MARYHATEPFDFPVGTVIAKTFSFFADARDPTASERLIETRILLRRPEGWVGLPYLWNNEQTEATLDVAGGTSDVTWIHADGRSRTVNYIVPNANQCKSCHAHNKANRPIGPKAKHLNKSFPYEHGVANQLEYWASVGILEGSPGAAQAPRLAALEDRNGATLEERARAWLDINCAHCHRSGGGAFQSGLDLSAEQMDWTKRGVWKVPVAAGRGSGGRKYDIVPGKPDESILVFRIESTEPGVMMPELPRRLVDVEGVALIRQWIAEMADPMPKTLGR